jgi:hypothetical protein
MNNDGLIMLSMPALGREREEAKHSPANRAGQTVPLSLTLLISVS